MIEIQRMTRKSKTIPLISLIDVVFQLLIYFMLSTSFTRTESLELSLPGASAPAQATVAGKDEKTLHIYIADSGETFLEQKSMSEQEMAQELRALLSTTPDRGVLIFSAGQVKVQAMVHVMDRIYSAGGKNIAVADWVNSSAPVSVSPTAPATAPVSVLPGEKKDHG